MCVCVCVYFIYVCVIHIHHVHMRRCIRVSQPLAVSGALCHDFDGLDLLAQDPQRHHQLRLVHLGHLAQNAQIGHWIHWKGDNM